MDVVSRELGYYSCSWETAVENYNAASFPMIFDEYSCTGDEELFS